jgi:hypothetical protein
MLNSPLSRLGASRPALGASAPAPADLECTTFPNPDCIIWQHQISSLICRHVSLEFAGVYVQLSHFLIRMPCARLPHICLVRSDALTRCYERLVTSFLYDPEAKREDRGSVPTGYKVAFGEEQQDRP